MKLQEFTSNKKGTYVGLRVLTPSSTRIYNFCQDNGIPINKSTHDRRLHTTLLYSRKPCPNIITQPETVHLASFIAYEIFDDILVAKINSPSIVARHLELMQLYDATYDFPVYIPHISLVYGFSGDVNLLPPLNVDDIMIGLEYSEELDE